MSRVRIDELLDAYDTELRTDAETPSAVDVMPLGPLRLVTFPGGRGFVTYPRLDDVDAVTLSTWVDAALHHFTGNPDITDIEWKTRGHDRLPHLDAVLRDHGFVAEEPESVMIGEATSLIADVALPAGVTLRTVTADADVCAASAMADAAFGDPVSARRADALIGRLARGDGMEIWIAEADGVIVSCGRLEPVPGTRFAGIWGGATLPAWRGRGIYRALTAERARSALRVGKTLINSDSTEFSRPILERSGLVKVSTTTPYTWTR